jgi:hypothetical protein
MAWFSWKFKHKETRAGWPNSKDILPSCPPKCNGYSGRKIPLGKLRWRWDPDTWKDTVDLFHTKNEKAAARGRRLERSWPENRLKCHRRINIILLIQGLMKYNKQIWQKVNNFEWSTGHDSCCWASKMWKRRPSYKIYSLLNITSCTHHEQTIRIHVGSLFAKVFTSVQCTSMLCQQSLLQER